MSISITNENKNTLNITNEDKPSGLTWADADFSWDEAEGTWEQAGTVLKRESKNTLNITNENK